jgi:hypothetical protein
MFLCLGGQTLDDQEWTGDVCFFEWCYVEINAFGTFSFQEVLAFDHFTKKEEKFKPQINVLCCGLGGTTHYTHTNF